VDKISHKEVNLFIDNRVVSVVCNAPWICIVTNVFV